MTPDAHDVHSMRVIHYTCVAIGVAFIGFGAFAITTRLGAQAPPASVSYGTEQAHPSATVIGR